MQAGRRRCSHHTTSRLLLVEFHRRLCSCTLKSLTRPGPLSVLSYATFGTRQTMPSSFIAPVSSLLWAARAPFRLLLRKSDSWERPHWDRSCATSSCDTFPHTLIAVLLSQFF
jgi:hypothetical protein